MTMTIVEAARGVTGGVDTHLDVHVAAALGPLGGLLGTERFETNAAGYKALLGWLGTFGDVTKVGVEGTGSYGSGLARYLRRSGVEVLEVDRPDRQKRRRSGKSDPLDAIEAARAALSGPKGKPKSRDGAVEAIRSSSSPSARPAKPGARPWSRCATSATALLNSSVAVSKVSRCPHWWPKERVFAQVALPIR
jgi:Transposase